LPKERVTRGSGLLETFLARRRAEMANRLIPSVCRTGCIADIGCGRYPYFLLNTIFSRKIGLDKSIEEALTKSEQTPNITFITHDVEQDPTLPIEDNSCDVVTMLAVIEHLEPNLVLPLLSAIHRILKPGGRLIVTVPAGWTDSLLRTMARLKLVSPVEIEEHKATYTHRSLSEILKKVFSEDSLKLGYFEMHMNIWATAEKPQS
jgi:SAM-dependent methyltransferase